MSEADRDLVADGAALAEAIEAVLPVWCERVVVERGGAALADRGRAAGQAAAADLGQRLHELLAADVDRQSTTPLAIVREAVRWPTEVLRAAGVPPVGRDPQDVAAFPDDVYALTPWSFADVDASLHELGIIWGARKARAHLVRHRGSP